MIQCNTASGMKEESDSESLIQNEKISNAQMAKKRKNVLRKPEYPLNPERSQKLNQQDGCARVV